MVNVAAIVVFILVQSARALKSGVVRPVDLEDSRTYKFAENDVAGGFRGWSPVANLVNVLRS